MRHKKAGKKLGRRKEERIALQRNLTRGLFQQFGEEREFIVTTTTKAKWVKPFAERCITLGIKGFRELMKAAEANGTSIDELKVEHTNPDRAQRKKFKDFSPKVREHLTKSIHYRRLAAQRLRCPETVEILFDEVAPRYLKRPGGYLRVLRTGEFRLGDKAQKAILGFTEPGEYAAPSAAPAEEPAEASA